MTGPILPSSIWVIFFLLSTIFFNKFPTVWLLLLSGYTLYLLWRSQILPNISRLVGYGGIAALLLLHTLCFSLDHELSLNFCLRLSGLFLEIFLLHCYLQEPSLFKFALPKASQFPIVLSFFGLFVCGLIGLHIQLMEDNALTHSLNMVLEALHLSPLRPPRTLKTHLALFMLAFFPFLGVSVRHPFWQLRLLLPLILAFSLVCSGIMMGAHTSYIALGIGSFIFLAAQQWPDQMIRLTSIGISLIFMTLPWLIRFFYTFIPLESPLLNLTFHSFKARLLHWNELVYFIDKRFWTGYGLGYSRILSQQPDLSHPLFFPHNMVLELWLDLGFIGICFVIGGLLALLKQISRLHDPLTRSSALACLVFVFIMNQTSYSNLSIWWLSAIVLTSFWLPVLCWKATQDRISLGFTALKSVPGKGDY